MSGPPPDPGPGNTGAGAGQGDELLGGDPATAAGEAGLVLEVDPAVRAGEVARFWAKVVRGPGERDCWLWVGAIADDGYGRFAIRRDGRERVVRPHRYAAALQLGVRLGPHDVVEHLVCDNPICVRAELAATGHVWPSTQAENLRRMGQRARGGGAWWQWRWAATDRASLAARSRAQRAAVRDGWDADALRAAVQQHDPRQGRLW